MMGTSKAIPDAMRTDLQSPPPEFRSKLLAMFCEAEFEKAEWWWNLLIGEGSPLHRELEAI